MTGSRPEVISLLRLPVAMLVIFGYVYECVEKSGATSVTTGLQLAVTILLLLFVGGLKVVASATEGIPYRFFVGNIAPILLLINAAGALAGNSGWIVAHSIEMKLFLVLLFNLLLEFKFQLGVNVFALVKMLPLDEAKRSIDRNSLHPAQALSGVALIILAPSAATLFHG